MADRRIALRKELAKLADLALVKRYAKNSGRLYAEEKARYINGRHSRELLIDLIVIHEAPRG